MMKSQLPVFNRPTVLVVEDDPLVRQVSLGLLRLLNCNTLEADSGAAALAVLRSGALVDLLFTDIVMPGEMNGFRLAEAARALRPELRVLFASGYSQEALPIREAPVPGCQVLIKPFGIAQLSQAMMALLPAAAVAG